MAKGERAGNGLLRRDDGRDSQEPRRWSAHDGVVVEEREQLLATMPVVVLLWCGRRCLVCPARFSSSQGNSSDQITGRPKAAFLSRPACLAHFHVPPTGLLRQRAVFPRDTVHLPLSIDLQLSAYKTARRHQRYHEIPPSTRLEGRVSG
jgi:hypothetical protein